MVREDTGDPECVACVAEPLFTNQSVNMAVTGAERAGASNCCKSRKPLCPVFVGQVAV